MQIKRNNRREFLKTTAASGVAGALAMGIPGTESKAFPLAEGYRTPNEQPGIAFIGTGIRFHTYHGPQAMKFGPCVGVCDVDAVQAGRALQVAVNAHRENGHPLVIDAVEDYRYLLDNDDVDVVVVGTVDHWHTRIVIDALAAGKHVYCEKPVTLTIREGQQILEAHEKYGGTIFSTSLVNIRPG
ncbi:MAG: Gfo/Idh/MocA family oxidoreductase [Planctomycetota bacterium]